MSTLQLHHLTGCAPAPLAHYLKALGVFRIIAEQADQDVRGWWQDEHFCLLTTLDADQLDRFMLDAYRPTPFVSPWNKGSGFFAANDPGLAPIEGSSAIRFEAFRKGVRDARGPLEALEAADVVVRAVKDKAKARKTMTSAQKSLAVGLKDDPAHRAELRAAEAVFKRLKADVFGPLRMRWRGPHRAWLDAAVVVLDDGRTAFPRLFGTGGNDGRIDFTNNAMQHLGLLFDVVGDGTAQPAAPNLLRSALLGNTSLGASAAAVGQFFPGSAGGANATTGPDGAAAVNSWDFILMLEGALLFSARSTRRLDPLVSSQASAPFVVRSGRVGYGSAGKEDAQRGEQWLPLWSRPATLQDVSVLLGEGRVQLGRHTARRPLDVARAIARLGTSRGVTQFVRYGYLERNGQSTFAVPLGRVDVIERPQARLIDDLASWLDRLERLTRDGDAPARLLETERRLTDAVFAALTHDAGSDRWQRILSAAATVEAVLTSGTGFVAGPIPPLSPEWLVAADDGTTEWRLACALGSAAASYDAGGRRIDTVRHHWMPLEPGAYRFRQHEKRLTADPRVVGFGRDAVADLGAVVERRVIEAAQEGQRRLPLVAANGHEAQLSDLAELVASRMDLQRVLSLARALMALRWDEFVPAGQIGRVSTSARPDAAWAAIRLATLPGPLDRDRNIPVDPALVRRLQAGDGGGALDIALRRLRAAGLRPRVRTAAVDPATAQFWAATLAFPISVHSARALTRSLE